MLQVATLLSPNVGDQGFLNSYFKGWYQQGPEHHIDYTYNALVRISVNPGWKQFIEPNLRILHFSGNTKPWNMMVDKQVRRAVGSPFFFFSLLFFFQRIMLPGA